MEDQGKRLLVAIGIAFILMLGWNYLFPPEVPETPPSQDEAGQVEDSAPAPSDGARKPSLRTDDGDSAETVGDRAPSDDRTPAAGKERGPEELFEFAFEDFRVVFSSYGGALKSWTLEGEKYRGSADDDLARQLDMVRTGDREETLPFRIGFDDLDLVPADAEWRGRRKSDTELEFTWTYEVEREGEMVTLFEIVKTFRIYPQDYLLELTVYVENKNAGDEKLSLVVSLFGYQDPDAETGGGWFSRVDASWKGACLVGDEFEEIPVGELSNLPSQRTGNVRWAGVSHSYFLAAASPTVDTDAELACRLSTVPGRPGVMRADIVFPVFNVGAGDPYMSRQVLAYLGPKYLDKLEAIPGIVGRDPGFGDSIDFGWFGVLSRPLLWLLQLLHSVFGNWGLAIVFLTVLVKLATLYWTTKSMRSMKRMSQLKPKIEVLQKKYKDDRQRQQQEMMNLYKAHGVNPMAGCLPMLLQMPIWFALYRMLMAAAELYHTPFIPGWIDDLTAADPVYVLPIVLVGMMFLQAKLSPTTPDSTQQKIMMYGLPLSFGLFSFVLPSGLTLYILTNTVLTTLHQLWLNRTDPHAREAVAKKAAATKGKRDDGGAPSRSDSPGRDDSRSPAAGSTDEASADAGAGSTGSAGKQTPSRGGGRGKSGNRRGQKKGGGKSRRR
ncbi:membrane protein insertase YidC [Haliangium sp.]|uniref:membrane protein insertase YidC n=1 Tax=Haliangium sp. TaxID=2663208 RepID=UPI003D1141DE